MLLILLKFKKELIIKLSLVEYVLLSSVVLLATKRRRMLQIYTAVLTEKVRHVIIILI